MEQRGKEEEGRHGGMAEEERQRRMTALTMRLLGGLLVAAPMAMALAVDRP